MGQDDSTLDALYAQHGLWWHHQMEACSAPLALCEGNPPVTGGFPSQRPVTRSFDVFFDLRLNKQLCKQPKRRWFGTPSRSLWRYCNEHGHDCKILPFDSCSTWLLCGISFCFWCCLTWKCRRAKHSVQGQRVVDALVWCMLLLNKPSHFLWVLLSTIDADTTTTQRT